MLLSTASDLTVHTGGSGWVFWAAVLTVILAVFGILGAAFRGARRGINAYHQDIRDTVTDLLDPILEKLAPVIEELTPNHGTSVKDRVARLDRNVDRITDTLDDHRSELRDFRKEFTAHVTEDQLVAKQVDHLINSDERRHPGGCP